MSERFLRQALMAGAWAHAWHGFVLLYERLQLGHIHWKLKAKICHFPLFNRSLRMRTNLVNFGLINENAMHIPAKALKMKEKIGAPHEQNAQVLSCRLNRAVAIIAHVTNNFIEIYASICLQIL